jgi:hypothetical protein
MGGKFDPIGGQKKESQLLPSRPLKKGVLRGSLQKLLCRLMGGGEAELLLKKGANPQRLELPGVDVVFLLFFE